MSIPMFLVMSNPMVPTKNVDVLKLCLEINDRTHFSYVFVHFFSCEFKQVFFVPFFSLYYDKQYIMINSTLVMISE